ncbi:hypothetical protein B0H13DRAFT_222911 [Mycena leptocephala]|nr:hypothetical protein B0H13DRAFT_222911 [Mycena leptocephala]
MEVDTMHRPQARRPRRSTWCIRQLCIRRPLAPRQGHISRPTRPTSTAASGLRLRPSPRSSLAVFVRVLVRVLAPCMVRSVLYIRPPGPVLLCLITILCSHLHASCPESFSAKDIVSHNTEPLNRLPGFFCAPPAVHPASPRFGYTGSIPGVHPTTRHYSSFIETCTVLERRRCPPSVTFLASKVSVGICGLFRLKAGFGFGSIFAGQRNFSWPLTGFSCR